mgnify:CR=1 FL=1
MIEMESLPATKVSRQLYFVSNVRTLVESLPDKQMRYVVVDAREGQPVAGATIELSGYVGGRSHQLLAKLTTDAKGEAVYRYTNGRPTEIYAYTYADKACLPMNGSGNFYYYGTQNRMERHQLFTDRSIYRPGQTVHVAAIAYEVLEGINQKALTGKTMRLTLRDANHKVVAEQTVKTDGYGTCAANFTLPSAGLTGHFSVETANGSHSFRVEEYKRPTFEVEFDQVVQNYQDGDTVVVKGTARSYAGVPVQGAKVAYKVERRRSLWWWAQVDSETVAEGTALTASDGTFTVPMPMVLPKTDYPMFYNFVCTADVTDQGGETHQGLTSLPLGNRKTAFSVDMPEQIRADQKATMTFHLRNAAGKDIDREVKYRLDGGEWLTVKSNSQLAIGNLTSGKHTVEAVCDEEKASREFIVFSLDDAPNIDVSTVSLPIMTNTKMGSY